MKKILVSLKPWIGSSRRRDKPDNSNQPVIISPPMSPLVQKFSEDCNIYINTNKIFILIISFWAPESSHYSIDLEWKMANVVILVSLIFNFFHCPSRVVYLQPFVSQLFDVDLALIWWMNSTFVEFEDLSSSQGGLNFSSITINFTFQWIVRFIYWPSIHYFNY